MAPPKLVGVPVGPEDLDLLRFDDGEALRLVVALAREVDGKMLAGDGLLVLHAGVADVGLSDAKGAGDPVDGVAGGQAAFFNQQVKVLPRARGFVKGLFIDEEVLGALLDDAADAGDVLGDRSGHGQMLARSAAEGDALKVSAI